MIGRFTLLRVRFHQRDILFKVPVDIQFVAVSFVFDPTYLLGLVYTERQRQRCNNSSDTGLIENNVFAPKWVATPF